MQRPQQDGGLPEDLLGLVQPVREVQTCNQVLGEEEGKMLKGKQYLNTKNIFFCKTFLFFRVAEMRLHRMKFLTQVDFSK